MLRATLCIPSILGPLLAPALAASPVSTLRRCRFLACRAPFLAEWGHKTYDISQVNNTVNISKRSPLPPSTMELGLGRRWSRVLCVGHEGLGLFSWPCVSSGTEVFCSLIFSRHFIDLWNSVLASFKSAWSPWLSASQGQLGNLVRFQGFA